MVTITQGNKYYHPQLLLCDFNFPLSKSFEIYLQAEEPLKEGQVDFRLLYIQAEEP